MLVLILLIILCYLPPLCRTHKNSLTNICVIDKVNNENVMQLKTFTDIWNIFSIFPLYYLMLGTSESLQMEYSFFFNK